MLSPPQWPDHSVHRLAQSCFLHAPADRSHNNRACSDRMFIVAITTVPRRNRTPCRWMKKSTTFSQALKKVDHLTDAISCSVVYTCTRTIIPATVHHLCGHTVSYCNLNSVLSKLQGPTGWGESTCWAKSNQCLTTWQVDSLIFGGKTLWFIVFFASLSLKATICSS